MHDAIRGFKCKLRPPKKAVGIYLISNELMKNDSVAKLLHKLFSLCWMHKMIPDQWRRAIIYPIPKETGRITDPLKYHGLSLQSCVYKLLSQIMNECLVVFLNENDLLDDSQNGFRKGQSCAHHIFSLCTTVKRNLQRGMSIFSGFIDFKKAFDYTDRGLLICRLKSCGVRGTFLKMIETMHSRTMNTIRSNGSFTEDFCSKTGVKQGNNLAPSLFSTFINDLLVTLKKMNLGVKLAGDERLPVLAYADDIESELQCMLDKVDEWCKNLRVSINVDKTKVMHFHQKRCKITDHIFTIGGSSLELVNKYKYLGIVVSEHCDEAVTTTQLANAGSRSLAQLIMKTKSNYDLGYHSFTKLFTTTTAAIMDYAVGAWWTGTCCRKMDQVQERAIRYYCGLPRNATIAGYLSDSGWIPGAVRRDVECLHFYNQLIRMDDNTIAKKVFLLDRREAGPFSKNIKTICRCCEINSSWEQMEALNVLATHNVNC